MTKIFQRTALAVIKDRIDTKTRAKENVALKQKLFDLIPFAWICAIYNDRLSYDG